MARTFILCRSAAEALNEDSECVMRRLNNFLLLAVGVAAGVAGSYWYTRGPEPISTPAAAEASHPAGGERKILYYRNPMGLPDTSPVPKKDTMGMEYIPVYDDERGEPGTVKVSLDKIQRIGVKTEKVEARQIVRARARGRQGRARQVASHRCRTPHGRLHRRAVRQQDGPARQQGRAAVPPL